MVYFTPNKPGFGVEIDYDTLKQFKTFQKDNTQMITLSYDEIKNTFTLILQRPV